MKRAPTKRDANHVELTDLFEQLGCSVQDLSHAGVSGWPDVVVGCMGANHLVEFKNPETRYGRAGLNRNQREFAQRWRGGTLYAVSTGDEVIALVQNWRRPA
ncbi:hypothetical protein QLQ15_17780 [Lysobacter sp. LF1]|uniref:VRR-NUC domain-containing protein n=1 Tax=Lysobacter stagni TaxID=3045172 RepID=A0ABT6XKS7_9GAMM|nr:hypothetical protein [Lysobacter sp. LF1]MDI9240757.1 hypothetical protein [Lysobacter sp. LF1]